MPTKQNRVNIALSDELLSFFQDRAAKSGQSLSSVIGLALYDYKNSLENNEKATQNIKEITKQFEAWTLQALQNKDTPKIEDMIDIMATSTKGLKEIGINAKG